VTEVNRNVPRSLLANAIILHDTATPDRGHDEWCNPRLSRDVYCGVPIAMRLLILPLADVFAAIAMELAAIAVPHYFLE